VTTGEVTASLSGQQDLGLPVDENQNSLVFEAGDDVSVSAVGFQPESEVDVTIYSEPTSLGKVSVDADGNLSAQITLPNNLETGNHTLVLSGMGLNKIPISVKFGIIVYGTSTNTPVWVWVLVAALLFGLAISTRQNMKQRSNRNNTMLGGTIHP